MAGYPPDGWLALARRTRAHRQRQLKKGTGSGAPVQVVMLRAEWLGAFFLQMSFFAKLPSNYALIQTNAATISILAQLACAKHDRGAIPLPD